MTDHRRFLELVAASIDFELTAEEHDLLAGHMATCRACRHEAAGFRQDAVAIAAFPQARLAPDVAAAVLERVLRRPARSHAMGRLLLAALVALLAIAAAAVGSGLIREWRDGLLVVPQPLPSREAVIASAGPSQTPSQSEEPAVATPIPSPMRRRHRSLRRRGPYRRQQPIWATRTHTPWPPGPMAWLPLAGSAAPSVPTAAAAVGRRA